MWSERIQTMINHCGATEALSNQNWIRFRDETRIESKLNQPLQIARCVHFELPYSSFNCHEPGSWWVLCLHLPYPSHHLRCPVSPGASFCFRGGLGVCLSDFYPFFHRLFVLYYEQLCNNSWEGQSGTEVERNWLSVESLYRCWSNKCSDAFARSWCVYRLAHISTVYQKFNIDLTLIISPLT